MALGQKSNDPLQMTQCAQNGEYLMSKEIKPNIAMIKTLAFSTAGFVQKALIPKAQ